MAKLNRSLADSPPNPALALVTDRARDEILVSNQEPVRPKKVVKVQSVGVKESAEPVNLGGEKNKLVARGQSKCRMESMCTILPEKNEGLQLRKANMWEDSTDCIWAIHDWV